MRFFTADTHFGHQNLIEHDNRPFKTSEEMDAFLISKWNSVVTKRDIVYHLGDFSWRGSKLARKIHPQLNGQIHLILGNHDDLNLKALSMFSSVAHLKIIRLEGIKIFMCHYALRTWVNKDKGAWNLYGHSHGRLSPSNNAVDVGVNCWDWAPVSFDRLKVFVKENQDESQMD